MMTTVNTLQSVSPLSVLESGKAIACDASDSAFTRINDIIMLMKKMNIEMRDTLRGFHDDMQKVTFDKQLVSLKSKQESIDQMFNGGVTGAIGQIVSGGLGFGGAITGSQLASAATTGLGRVTEGVSGVVAAGENLEAKEAQVLGEFQAEAADTFAKNVAATAERAAEASRQLRDATRELVGLYERMANAVQLRAG